ncbi:MAG: hypothetical protein ACXAD7_01340 [Candidatus Kariarchaeaceae archaeon]|jgi:hypothetical protein
MEGINDIFIQNANGIAYVARCYGGNYCKINPDHALVAGFFAAINSFKGEMGQKEFTNVIYDQINLVFESEGDLLVIFNLEKDVDEPTLRALAQEFRVEFMSKYGKDNEIDVSPDQYFDEVIEWMDGKLGEGAGDLRGLLQSKSKSLLGKIKSWLR